MNQLEYAQSQFANFPKECSPSSLVLRGGKLLAFYNSPLQDAEYFMQRVFKHSAIIHQIQVIKRKTVVKFSIDRKAEIEQLETDLGELNKRSRQILQRLRVLRMT